MKTVYLAGPVVGLTPEEANTWRREVTVALAAHGIKAISPLRCEPMIGGTYAMSYNDPKFGTAKAIGAKNEFDVRSCDVTLAYIPRPSVGHPHHSWGTMGELAAAHFLGKATILVSDDSDVYLHPVLSAWAGWVLEDMADAIDVLIGLLGDYDADTDIWLPGLANIEASYVNPIIFECEVEGSHYPPRPDDDEPGTRRVPAMYGGG